MALDDNLSAFMAELNPEHIAPLIDHTALHALSTTADIDRLVSEAKQYGFASICIPPRLVSYAASQFAGSSVKIATVVNFPLANDTDAAVCFATADAIRNGAKEVDMVANPTLIGTPLYAAQIHAVAQTVSDAGGEMLKVIIEAGYCTPEMVRSATEAVVCVARKFPSLCFQTKTSTGMAVEKYLVAKYDGSKKVGARVEDLHIIVEVHQACGLENLGIKAAGGIGSYQDAALALYAMGARHFSNLRSDKYRIGASSGVSIVKGK